MIVARRQSRQCLGAIIFPLLLLLVLAFFLLNYLHALYFTPMTDGETFFRILVRGIQRLGRPIDTNGTMFQQSSPLLLYFQAAIETWVPNSPDNLRTLRLIQTLIYTIPIMLLSMIVSRQLFGRIAGWLVFILYAGVAYFYKAAITESGNLPFGLASVLLLFLMMQREIYLEEGRSTQGLDIVVGLTLALGFLIQPSQALVLELIIGTIIVMQMGRDRASSAKSAIWVFLISFIGPLIWMFWLKSHGSSITEAQSIVVASLFNDETVFRSVSVLPGDSNYLLRVVNTVSLPLLVMAATTLIIHFRSWRLLCLPLLWIFWYFLSLTCLQPQYITQYFAALPATIVVASGVCSERVWETLNYGRQGFGWFIGVVILGLLLMFKLFIPTPYVWFGMKAELYRIDFLIAAALCLVLYHVPICRAVFGAALIAILVGGVFIFSLEYFPLLTVSRERWDGYLEEVVAGKELQRSLPTPTLLATPSLVVAYYADRNYLKYEPKNFSSTIGLLKEKKPPYLTIDTSVLTGKSKINIMSYLEKYYQFEKKLNRNFLLYRHL